MIRKPWPIIMMSFIFFLIPIFNIMMTYILLKKEFSFSDYIYSLLTYSKNYWALFDMIVPSLIVGIAIYAVKKWSYPVFLIGIIWITFRMSYDFSSQISFFQLFFSLIFPMILNFFLVSYFLLPEVRATYFDPKLHWWESKPRYVFSTDINLGVDGKQIQGKITNISEGGVFAIISSPIEPHSIVDLSFDILGTAAQLKAQVVYRKADGSSHGLQFVEMTKDQNKLLKKIITRLKKDKYEETKPHTIWTEDLKNWFLVLIKTGKGLVPNISVK